MLLSLFASFLRIYTVLYLSMSMKTIVTTAVTFALVLLNLSVNVWADSPTHEFAPGGIRDFAAYWAAARLLLTGGNVYSPAEIFALQKSIGMTESMPLIMWNPPWTLSFVWPFGLFEFTLGQFLWLVSHCLLVLVAADQLSSLYCRSPQRLRISCVLVFSYIPCVYALVIGQITPLILFALVLFVVSVQKQRWLVAGVSLALLAIKPHFIYLFWLALVLWVWWERRWQVASWAALIFITASALPLLFDPGIYGHFVNLYRSGDYLKPLDLAAPTLRNVLQEFFGLEGWFFDYLPSALGAVWLVWHWHKHRNNWHWVEQLPLLLLVSITTSVYAWTFDQTIFIPAIVQVYGWYEHKTSIVVIAFLVFNALYLQMRYLVPLDFWYFWMAPSFLAGYCLLRRKHTAQRT